MTNIEINLFLAEHLFGRKWYKTKFGRLLLDEDTAIYLKYEIAAGTEPIYEPEMKRRLWNNYNYCSNDLYIGEARSKIKELGLEGKFVYYLLNSLKLSKLPLTFDSDQIFLILNSSAELQARAMVYAVADKFNIEL